MKLIVNNLCYWQKCPEEPCYEWHGQKTAPLLVCQTHYELLIQVYDTVIVSKKGNFTIVEVLPDQEFVEEEE